MGCGLILERRESPINEPSSKDSALILDRFRLDGKAALVTGAGTGLGAAMALGLAEAGADVAALGRRENLVAETARRIEELGRRALAIGADVTNAEDVTRAVEQTKEALGGVNVLINGAGVINADPSADVSPEDFRFVVDVNLTGAFLCAQAAGRGMIARGAGSIVNIGTFLGERGHRPARAAYNASKYGVVGLTKALAAEWGGQGVRVNCICPGVHRTPMLAPALADPEVEKGLNERTILGRVGEPADIVGLAVFLASDASAYITGESIFEDGGGWL